MPPIFTVNFIGKEFWYWPTDAPTPLQPPFPVDVIPTGNRPSIISHRGRSYISGAYSSPLVFDEDANLNTIGLLPPAAAPTLAASSGAGNVDGEGYGQYAYRYKIGTKIVCESDLSPPSASITFANKQAEWTNLLPSPETKATHIVGYRSMDGGLPREAFERGVGTTAVTENRPELALGDAPPNNRIILNEARGVPPWTLFNEAFHNRAWYAGDPQYPFRVWYSEVDEYEAVGGSSYIDTRDGEPVTGISRHRDTLIVFCRRCMYVIRGYTRNDFTIFKLDSEVGCISHHSIVSIDNALWWASEEGVYAYDGGRPQYVMEDLRNFWHEEYEADPTPFLNCAAELDPKEQLYKLLTPRTVERADPVTAPETPASVYYICDFSDGRHWFIDKRDRIDSALGKLADGRLVTGSQDGYVRLENNYEDGTDDSDTYDKELLIRTRHFLFDDPGGTKEDGKELVRVWSYVTREGGVGDASDAVLWTFRAKGGDEESWQQMDPDNTRVFFKDDVEKTQLINQEVTIGSTVYSYNYTPVCVRVHPVIQKVVGRGFTFEYVAPLPLDFRFLGLGGNYKPGTIGRTPTSEDVVPPPEEEEDP